MQVVVILVGTNNSGTPEKIADGILETVKVAREKQPEAYIVLLVCTSVISFSFSSFISL